MSQQFPVISVQIPDHLPKLGRGAHRPGSAVMCAMEAASWLSGDDWSDHPKTVHPAVAAIARWVNDNVTEDERQRLWPLIVSSIGTGTGRRHALSPRLVVSAIRAQSKAVACNNPRQAWEELLGVLTPAPGPTKDDTCSVV